MSNKTLKFVIAFGLLAVLLIFLAVNFVPRISAMPSAIDSSLSTTKYSGPDYIERHPPAKISSMNSTSPDWIERHAPKVVKLLNDTEPDWIDRHTPGYYDNSDWIERHSGLKKP